MDNTKTDPTSVQKIKELHSKLIYGDFTTLSKILGISPDAAKKRFLRGNQQAFDILQKIVDARDELKQQFSEE